MASYIKNPLNIKDAENISNGLANKSNNKSYIPKVTKRTALCEVSNKMCNQTKKEIATKENIQSKNVCQTKNEKAILKKPTCFKKQEKNKNNLKNGKPEKSQNVALLKCNPKNIEEKETRLLYSSQHRFGVLDIDNTDKHDPLLVAEYVQDIYKYLYEMETLYPINKHFLDSHKSTPSMRSILINWMVEVHWNFHFLPETLHLSVSIVDRYLQINKNIGRETLQLVGTSAMFIASKYEETYLPAVTDFVYVCDDAFPQTQIFQMEREILSKLGFALGRPIAIRFLRRFNKAAKVQQEHHCLGKYLMELALLDYEMCHIIPSQQAAAACCLSICILNEVLEPCKVWTKQFVNISTYMYADIESVVKRYAQLLSKSETSKYQAIRKKYANYNNCRISLNSKLKGPTVSHILSSYRDVK